MYAIFCVYISICLFSLVVESSVFHLFQDSLWGNVIMSVVLSYFNVVQRIMKSIPKKQIKTKMKQKKRESLYIQRKIE